MPHQSKPLDPIDVAEFRRMIQQKITGAEFAMLRYETEFTPCTGITAVTRQERRHFSRGVMISPWCSCLKREKSEDDPLQNGKVRETGWEFDVCGIPCKVLAATDGFAPIIFLDVQGRFRGLESPYDTPPEPPNRDSLATLKMDTLYFGLAVRELLREAAVPRTAFIWGADWETVPALLLVRDEHNISLTLHNTFDECLEKEAVAFGTVYTAFRTPSSDQPARTALQIGLEIADVVTTVNKGFAEGMGTEELQTKVMAEHLQDLIRDKGVVGIDNAAFTDLSEGLPELSKLLSNNFEAGRKQLFEFKRERVKRLQRKLRDLHDSKIEIIHKLQREIQQLSDIKGEEERVKELKQKFSREEGKRRIIGRLQRLLGIKKENQETAEEIPECVADKAIVVSMGRRVSQKQHDVFVECLREILTKVKDFPVLAVFATVHGDDSTSPAILARIKALEAEFPSSVVCEDGRLDYYKELMAAADFNCMPSLYEPHGGAYEGTVIPIARAVDGLAEQICGYKPLGVAKSMNDRWHGGEQPTGFLFREEATAGESTAEQLKALLQGSPFSCVFRAMRDSLAAVLREAVDLRLKHEDEYARLVGAALKKQEGTSWEQNLKEMLELMEQARKARSVA